jgi:hypothetical protein
MPKSQKEQIELEDLLKLKRHESPNEDFWKQFDQDFERRRLQALLSEESDSVNERSFAWIGKLFAGGAGLAAASAVVVLFGFQSSALNLAFFKSGSDAQTAAVGQSSIMEMEVAMAPREEVSLAIVSARNNERLAREYDAEFILDTIAESKVQQGYESIHDNTVFSQSLPSDSQFVSDAYGQSDGRYTASFAVARPAARF